MLSEPEDGQIEIDVVKNKGKEEVLLESLIKQQAFLGEIC